MHSQTNFKRVWACLGAAAVLGVAGCGGDDGDDGGGGGDGGGGDEPLRVGLAQPLTGPVAAAGIAVRDGAEIAVEEINEAGGVDGRPIELVIEDNANEPATCTNVAQQMSTQANVPVVIGFWGSSCTLPAIPVLERAGIPLVVETAGAPAITDPEEAWNDMVFRLAPTGSQEAAAMGPVLREELKTETFFQLAVNNDFGRSFADAYTSVLEELGATEGGRAYFDQGDQDFSNQVTQARRAGADTIIIITDVGQIATILREMRSQGVDANVVTSGGSNNPEEVVRLAGEAPAEGHHAAIYFPYFDTSLSADPEKAEGFVSAWEEAGHERGQLTESARGYDAVYTVADALGRASDPTAPEAVAEALRDVQLDGVMFGEMQFQDWEGLRQQNVQPMFLSRVQDGEVELVTEAEPPS